MCSARKPQLAGKVTRELQGSCLAVSNHRLTLAQQHLLLWTFLCSVLFREGLNKQVTVSNSLG